MKKTLSIILAAVLVFSAFTILPLTVSAADDDTAESGAEGDYIPTGISGNGSASSPYIVSKMADLKTVMNSTQNCYIQVNSFETTPGRPGSYYLKDTDYETRDLVFNIPENTTKHLIWNAHVEIVDNIGDKHLYSFCGLYGTLYLEGNGYLGVSFKTRFPNAIFFVDYGKLYCNGTVKLRADTDAAYLYGGHDTYGHAIVVKNQGYAEINGGTYIGRKTDAVSAGGKGVVINGGTFTIEERESDSDYVISYPNFATIKGGTFTYLSSDAFNYLADGCYLVDTETESIVTSADQIDPEKTYRVVDGTIATVTFDSNGGSGTMEPVTVKKGSTYTLPECTFTPPSGKVFDKWAVNGTISFGTITQITVNEDTVLEAQWKDAPSSTYSITGSTTSFLEETDSTIVFLSKKSGDNYALQGSRTVSGNSGTYGFTGLSNGQYKLSVRKNNHVTREYNVTILLGSKTQDVTICPVGDVSGDGKVTTKDYAMANAHAQKVSLLTDYALKCGDVLKNDGKITTADAARINAAAQKVDPLW